MPSAKTTGRFRESLVLQQHQQQRDTDCTRHTACSASLVGGRAFLADVTLSLVLRGAHFTSPSMTSLLATLAGSSFVRAPVVPLCVRESSGRLLPHLLLGGARRLACGSRSRYRRRGVPFAATKKNDASALLVLRTRRRAEPNECSDRLLLVQALVSRRTHLTLFAMEVLEMERRVTPVPPARPLYTTLTL